MRETVKAPSGAVYEIESDFTGNVQFPAPVEIKKVGSDEKGHVRYFTAKVPWEDVKFLAAQAWREELIGWVHDADPMMYPVIAALLIGARDGR